MLNFNMNTAKACVAALFLVALVTATSASRVATEGAASSSSAGTATTTTNPFVLIKRLLLGGPDDADVTTNATTTTATATTTMTRAETAASAVAAASSSLDLAASAAALGVSEASLKARGLQPEKCPHNISHEARDRRELNELEGWMDARATWYGGPSGPGPDGMSIYTGSCGYGTISNHFISAWQGEKTGKGVRVCSGFLFIMSDIFLNKKGKKRQMQNLKPITKRTAVFIFFLPLFFLLFFNTFTSSPPYRILLFSRALSDNTSLLVHIARVSSVTFPSGTLTAATIGASPTSAASASRLFASTARSEAMTGPSSARGGAAR